MKWRTWVRAAAQLAAGALMQSLVTAELTARWQGRWAAGLDVAAALVGAAVAGTLAWRWRRGRLAGPIVLDGAPGLVLLALLALGAGGGALGGTPGPELRAGQRSDSVGP
jgi:hypothetical protein